MSLTPVQIVVGAPDGSGRLVATGTVGNTWVCLTGSRTSPTNLPATGPTWTTHPHGTITPGNDGGRMYWRPVDVGDVGFVKIVGTNSTVFAVLIELPGLIDVDVTTFQDVDTFTQPATVGPSAITPTAGFSAILIQLNVMNCSDWGGNGNTTYTDPAGFTRAAADEVTFNGDFHPASVVYYKTLPLTTGITYDGRAAVVGAGNNFVGYGHLAAVFTQAPPAPTPGVWIDVAGNGFDDGTGTASDDGALVRMMPQSLSGSGISDNVTLDVKKVTWNRPGDPFHAGSTPPDGATIIVNNSDGKYTPTNAGSPFYNLLRPGRPVWIGINEEDGTLFEDGLTVKGIFAGRVNKVVPLPKVGYSEAVEAQIICDGIAVPWRGRKINVEFSENRSVEEFRTAILEQLGIDSDHTDLDSEGLTLKYSGILQVSTERIALGSLDADDRSRLRPPQPFPDGLSVLEELNRITGTRHAIVPADTKEDWFTYKTFNRAHKVGDANDAAWANDDQNGMNGYELSLEGVVNSQDAVYIPVNIDTQARIVWEYASVPFNIAVHGPVVIYAQFGDFVFDLTATWEATTDHAHVSVTVVNYGDGAIVQIVSILPTQITKLVLSGRRIVRLDAQTFNSIDTTSANDVTGYGKRDGNAISSDYMQNAGAAEGIAAFLVHKFANPLARPEVIFKNRTDLTAPRVMYDVIGLSNDQIHISGKRLEVVGFAGEIVLNRTDGPTYIEETIALQETPEQSALNVFKLDSSALDGTDGLGY